MQIHDSYLMHQNLEVGPRKLFKHAFVVINYAHSCLRTIALHYPLCFFTFTVFPLLLNKRFWAHFFLSWKRCRSQITAEITTRCTHLWMSFNLRMLLQSSFSLSITPTGGLLIRSTHLVNSLSNALESSHCLEPDLKYVRVLLFLKIYLLLFYSVVLGGKEYRQNPCWRPERNGQETIIPCPWVNKKHMCSCNNTKIHFWQ